MHYNFLIIGTGIIGLCIARNIITKHPDAKVVMLKKEADVGWRIIGLSWLFMQRQRNLARQSVEQDAFWDTAKSKFDKRKA